jgi:hypothetical protein
MTLIRKDRGKEANLTADLRGLKKLPKLPEVPKIAEIGRSKSRPNL